MPSRPRRPLAVLALVAALAAFPLASLASDTFADVPDSNPFHADINALANSGVTSGCGGGNFCPSANVTREQMAAFMNRLGALAPGKTPVVNADKVDGLDAIDVAAGLAPIPSGTTVTGSYVWDWATVADNQDVTLEIQLPGLASSDLENTTVNFAPSVFATDDDATCTGSAGAPTAPAGKVCIYINDALLVDSVHGLAAPGWTADQYFRVRFFQNSASSGLDMYIYFTWAYTAS